MVETLRERVEEILEETEYNLGYIEWWIWGLDWLVKTRHGREMIERVRERIIPGIDTFVYGEIIRRAREEGIELTPGELRVASVIAQAVIEGWSYRDIARVTGLAVSTVRTYVSRLRRLIEIPYIWEWGEHRP